MTTPTTNEDAELDQLIRHIIFSAQYNRRDRDSLDKDVAGHKTTLTHYIERKTVERAIEELFMVLGEMERHGLDEGITYSKIYGRHEKLKSQLHKLDGEQV